VILYIDDLDRCKPEDVVRVLQITHMLLAFELFVVVVAVDAAWVEQALIQSYPWLKKENKGSTPAATSTKANEKGSAQTPPPVEINEIGAGAQDYLEKIFQIAFWLEPMSAPRAASYLASLVRTSARGPDSAAMYSGSRVEITALELDYMKALAAYVGPSPRRVKRLVNAYRLIKGRMSDAQLSTFLTDRTSQDGGFRSGPYQIVIGLLVIGTGAQSETSEIIEELAEWDPNGKFEDVIQRFAASDRPAWKTAARVIETLMRTQKTSNVSELRGWARKVGRFLLHSPSEKVRLENMASVGKK